MVNEQVSRGYGSSSSSAAVRLVLDRLTVENSSSFHLSKMVCRALQTRGYHVLIGPPDPSLRQVNFHFLCFTDLCGFSEKNRVARLACYVPFRVCYVRVVSPNDMHACSIRTGRWGKFVCSLFFNQLTNFVFEQRF